MGASTSVNKQTFNISGSNNTLTSIPKISSSATVPTSVSKGINPVIYDGMDSLSILSDLTTSNFLAAVEGIEFDTFIPTEEEILADEQLTEQLRLFGITPSTFKGVFKGLTSINANTITSFTKGLSNVLNVVSNSSDNKSALVNAAVKIAPHAGKFLKNLWDKRSGSRPHDKSVLLTSEEEVIPSEQMNNTTDLITSDIISIPRLIEISKSGCNPLHDITIGKDRPSLVTSTEGTPIAKSDAILSNQLLVPFATTVNAISSISSGSTIAEETELTASGVCAATSSSSPHITVTPPDTTLVAALNSTPQESRSSVIETVALGGSKYGLSLENNVSRSGNTNVLQEIVDSTPVPGKQGMTIKNIDMMKTVFFRDFDNYDIEVLIANPGKINLTDAPNTTYISNQSWLEFFSPRSSPRAGTAYKRYFVNNSACSGTILPVTSYQPSEIESVDASLQWVTLLMVHDYDYVIDDIYSDYNGTVTMVFSLYTDSKVPSVRKNIFPGLLVQPKGYDQVVFIPARPIDSGNTSFRLSFNTSNVETSGMSFDVKGKGAFTFCIAARTSEADTIKAGESLFTLEISDASVNMTKSTTSPTLGTWIFNRERVSAPLLSFVNTIHPGILESRAANDVNVYWQKMVSKYVPYINTITQIACKRDYDIFYASMLNTLNNVWDKERDPLLPSTYKVDDIESVKRFCKYAITSMNSWMYYSADNVFDYVLPEYRTYVAWRLITFIRSLVPISIYHTTSAQTILSAWENIQKVTSEDDQKITDVSLTSDPATRKHVLSRYFETRRSSGPSALHALRYNSRCC